MPKRRGFLDRALDLVGLTRSSAVSSAVRGAVFAAGAYNRLTQDWFTSLLSADQEIKGDLRRLRGASRALARDNSYASRYLEMLAENVIGPTGIRMQAQAANSRGGLNKALNDRIEHAFNTWGEPGTASVDGCLSWVDIQSQAIIDMARDGEFLAREIRGADNEFNYALQHLDADQLDEQLNVPIGKSQTGNEIRMGVEIDRFGKPVAYWIWSDHPNDPRRSRKHERYPADQIIHLFRARRAGQTRGVPWFAPVMLDQQMLQGYQEAEITAARIAASNMAAVAFDAEKAAGIGDPPTGEDAIPVELEPGRFMRLAPGESLVSTDFNHPNTAFGPFTKDIKRSIATGLNVAYTSLSGDLEAVNYSSIRAGLLAERDFYRGLHVWLPARLHARVYRSWAPLAAVSGWFSASDARGTEKVCWQPRGWKWVDPVNDLQAASLAVQLGVASRTQFAAEQGRDFEEVIDEIADEEAYANQAGVTLGQDPAIQETKTTVEDQSANGSGSGAPTTPAKPVPSGHAIPLRRSAR